MAASCSKVREELQLLAVLLRTANPSSRAICERNDCTGASGSDCDEATDERCQDCGSENHGSGSNGAVIPNSAISLKSTSGDDLYEGKTHANGVWNVNGIAIGTYKLKIMASGFKNKDEDVRVVAPATSTTRTLMVGDLRLGGSPVVAPVPIMIGDIGKAGNQLIERAFQEPALQLHPSLVQIDPLPLIPQPTFRKR